MNPISNLLVKLFYTNWGHFGKRGQKFSNNVKRLEVYNALFALSNSFTFVRNIGFIFRNRLIYVEFKIETLSISSQKYYFTPNDTEL